MMFLEKLENYMVLFPMQQLYRKLPALYIMQHVWQESLSDGWPGLHHKRRKPRQYAAHVHHHENHQVTGASRKALICEAMTRIWEHPAGAYGKDSVAAIVTRFTAINARTQFFMMKPTIPISELHNQPTA